MKSFLYMPVLLFQRYYKALWLRVTLYALLSVTVAGGAAFLRGMIPDALTERIGSDAVMPVLTILASSMLAVTTFSLNVMVSAHRGAANNTTPRIHRLLLADTTTQSVLATFIGAFVYALSTIILFRTTLYQEDAAVLVMGVTIVVVVLVIVAMLRWIEHLSTLGSLDDVMRMSFDEAQRSLKRLNARPALGGVPITAQTILPSQVTDIPAPCSGYVQIINMAELNTCAGEGGAIYVSAKPGTFVLEGQPLAQFGGQLSRNDIGHLAGCFVIGDQRTTEQDPEIGLVTLSEISSKALSAGINDPGTAIEVIARVATLIWDYARHRPADLEPAFAHVFMADPSAADLIEAGFAGTARDGAGQIEVVDSLGAALTSLAQGPDAATREAATAMAARAASYATTKLTLTSEKAKIETP